MQKRILPIALTAIILLALFSWNCTKFDTTRLGSDLLPAVDNVNTFDTILNINSSQGFFGDSAVISKYDDHALGMISNDPLFGTTKAEVYAQFKPPFYPYYYGNVNDTIVAFDSVVLCLKFTGYWGETTQPINLDVREVSDSRFRDSGQVENKTNYKPNVGALIGSKSIDVRTLGDYVKLNNGRDSVRDQIRIKLSASWAAQLFAKDSVKANISTNAFFSDERFRSFYNGIAIIPSTGNGLMYIRLADTATKLEVHYKKKNGGKVDSIYTSFRFNPSLDTVNVANKPASNSSNYIQRNRAGFPISNPTAGEHYIQTTPGTYVNLQIPGLAGLSNRIIHRAEIIVEQIPTNPILDDTLSAPTFLYLDLKDTGATIKYKPIYFDLNTSVFYDPDQKLTFQYVPGTIDYNYYGGYRRTKNDAFGNSIKYYNFNISRYVQNVVSGRLLAYDMRIHAPFNINYAQLSTSYIPYGNNMAAGRVRIGSGSNPNYRLRLRIVYSKL